MSFSKPKAPKETADVKALRERQVLDLAQLDEQQNSRIKALFRARSGGRAFRAPTAMTVARNSSGASAAGSGGASLIPHGIFGRLGNR